MTPKAWKFTPQHNLQKKLHCTIWQLLMNESLYAPMWHKLSTYNMDHCRTPFSYNILIFISSAPGVVYNRNNTNFHFRLTHNRGHSWPNIFREEKGICMGNDQIDQSSTFRVWRKWIKLPLKCLASFFFFQIEERCETFEIVKGNAFWNRH